MDLEQLRTRYINLSGEEGTSRATLAALQKLLEIQMPDDFQFISTFYSGGALGGISMNAITSAGPASNIGQDTLRFRNEGNLPRSMIVLAELDESFIVLDTNPNAGRPAVIWCDNYDIERLSNNNSLNSPTVWDTYADFFAYLLQQEELNRRTT